MMEKNQYVTKISWCALGIACGLTWGLMIAGLGLMNSHLGRGTQVVQLLSSLYLGFNASVKGLLIGFSWGLGCGFVKGVLIALFYNLCMRYCSCKCCSSSNACNT